MMDGVSILHFCHFLESVASCFGKHCGKSHETRDKLKDLAHSCSDSLGQLPGRSCRSSFPSELEAMELSNGLST